MEIVPQTTTQPLTAREKRKMRRSTIAYNMRVRQIEAQQKRMDAAHQMTADFLGYDNGDIIFAA